MINERPRIDPNLSSGCCLTDPPGPEDPAGSVLCANTSRIQNKSSASATGERSPPESTCTRSLRVSATARSRFVEFRASDEPIDEPLDEPLFARPLILVR